MNGSQGKAPVRIAGHRVFVCVCVSSPLNSSHKNINFTGRCPVQAAIHEQKSIKHYSLPYSNREQQRGTIPDISTIDYMQFVLVMLKPLITIHLGHSPAGLMGAAVEWLLLNDVQRRHVSSVLLHLPDVHWAVCQHLMIHMPKPMKATNCWGNG